MRVGKYRREVAVVMSQNASNINLLAFLLNFVKIICKDYKLQTEFVTRTFFKFNKIIKISIRPITITYRINTLFKLKKDNYFTMNILTAIVILVYFRNTTILELKFGFPLISNAFFFM